jgi:hypothetical protein
MEHPEIALVLSAVCFSLVVGFLAGYGVRAYISLLHRRANRAWQGAGLFLVGAKRDRGEIVPAGRSVDPADASSEADKTS